MSSALTLSHAGSSHSHPPTLTARGLTLSLALDAFGALRSSAEVAGDARELRSRMMEDGYLYLPGLLDRASVEQARHFLTAQLASEGFLDPAYPAFEAIARPGADLMFRPDLARGNAALDQVLYSEATLSFYRLFLGEEVRHYDFTWLRAAAPGRNSSPHCDIVYMGRGTFDVLTAWTPLGDIRRHEGGLMILEGSHHKRTELADYLRRDVDTYCVNTPDTANTEWDGILSHDAAGLQAGLGGRWLSADFQMGDLLIFTMGTVHASLDNLSDRIRLSSDSRYQRASEPADERWIGESPSGHSTAAKRGRVC